MSNLKKHYFFLKNRVAFFLSIIMFLVGPLLVFASIEKIVFTTDPQTVLPNQISGPITIQTQTADGVKEDLTETLDLVFSSDSASGEFLSSSGNPTTKYMSKSSANRTFYYRDSNLGEHSIAVAATGRDSGQKFSASQKIIIGDSPAASSTSDTEQDSSAGSITNSPAVSGGGYSAHSSQADLSDYDEVTPSIGAGRPRLVIVGSPVDFRAEQSKGAGSINHYVWSFGDGSSVNGQKVSHSYQFPGEYNVVLNGDWANTQLVARTKVLVQEAKVALTQVDRQLGFVEISNQGSKEVNLGGWIIRGAGDQFLSSDTIIDAGKSIKVPIDQKIFNATSGQISLISASGSVLVSRQAGSVVELENKLVELKKQLTALRSAENEIALGDVSPQTPENDQKKSASKIITLTPKLSWWQKMFRMGQ